MTDFAITGMRWTMVAVYALIAWQVCHDGTSAGDAVGLAVVGSVVISAVVFADWINRAPRREE
jgi:hypothetical protein